MKDNMMTRKLTLNSPVKMTEDIMKGLEQRGLIIRLSPNNHALPVKPGVNSVASVYESQSTFGPHKLISVTINCSSLAFFGSHPDNEEFLLIGDQAAKPLYLVICLYRKKELEIRIETGQLEADDFICLLVKYNDPKVSFFTMLSGVPHGEYVRNEPGQPPTFYVTESRDLGIDITDFGEYDIVLP